MTLAIHHHEQHTIALNGAGMLNASLLARRFCRSIDEYLLLEDTQAELAAISESNGKPLPAKWQDAQTRIRYQPDFMRALATAGIVRGTSGTVGGHVAAAPGIAGNGLRDHTAGLWVHQALASRLARWLECRAESWKPSPLADAVEQALQQQGVIKPAAKRGAAQSAANTFAGLVTAEVLGNLRKMDQILINGGHSFADRRQTLQARLEQQATQEA